MINRRRTITPEEEEMFEAVLRGEKVLLVQLAIEEYLLRKYLNIVAECKMKSNM